MDAYHVFKATGKTAQAQKEDSLDMDRVAKLETENDTLKKQLADVLARLSKIEGQLKGGAPAAAPAAEEEDSDVDLFASDDEVDEESHEALHEEALHEEGWHEAQIHEEALH